MSDIVVCMTVILNGKPTQAEVRTSTEATDPVLVREAIEMAIVQAVGQMVVKLDL